MLAGVVDAGAAAVACLLAGTVLRDKYPEVLGQTAFRPVSLRAPRFVRQVSKSQKRFVFSLVFFGWALGGCNILLPCFVFLQCFTLGGGWNNSSRVYRRRQQQQ